MGIDTLAACRVFDSVDRFLKALPPAALIAAEDYARMLIDPSRPIYIMTTRRDWPTEEQAQAEGLARRAVAEAVLNALKGK
ncbi:hypothetical protein [Limnoglobus roseus]|nr:hypothetical protein [Limnoglobus roseus]